MVRALKHVGLASSTVFTQGNRDASCCQSFTAMMWTAVLGSGTAQTAYPVPGPEQLWLPSAPVSTSWAGRCEVEPCAVVCFRPCMSTWRCTWSVHMTIRICELTCSCNVDTQGKKLLSDLWVFDTNHPAGGFRQLPERGRVPTPRCEAP